MATPEGFENVPEQMNVPVECVTCGSLFQLFGPEDLSDMCDCNGHFRIFVGDAGEYTGALAMFVDNAESIRDELKGQ